MSPFNKDKVKAVFYIKDCDNESFTLIEKNRSQNFKISKEKEEFLTSDTKICFAYGEIRFHNISFIRFLDKKFNKNNPRLDFDLLKKDSSKLATLAAVIDAEGYIYYKSLIRRVQIRMKDKGFIEDVKKLCHKLGVDSVTFSNTDIIKGDRKGWQIVISSGFAFQLLVQKGLLLFQSKKWKKLKNICKSYKKLGFPRNHALNYYLSFLKKQKQPMKLTEIAKALNRNKNVVSYQINRLRKIGKVNRRLVGQTHYYFIP